jgi:GNAT superfamily N-acetyltransferase
MLRLPDTPVEAHGTCLRVRSAAGLTYEGTTSASDGRLEEFFAAYDQAFVLPNEKEGLAGFAACLRLNEGCQYDRLCRRYGPFREFIVAVRLAGELVGGLNFVAFPLVDPDASRPALSVNLNYIFVLAAYRRRGVLKRMVGDLPRVALALFGDDAAACLSVYIFIEQNDPYRMSARDYALDTEVTGLDQLARIALWARQGARIIDFAYVQPALTAEQAPDANLVYAVLGAPRPTLHPEFLRQHLERFFAISVLKGGDPRGNNEARQQLDSLAECAAEGARLALLELKDVSQLPAAGGALGARERTLREVLAPV